MGKWLWSKTGNDAKRFYNNMLLPVNHIFLHVVDCGPARPVSDKGCICLMGLHFAVDDPANAEEMGNWLSRALATEDLRVIGYVYCAIEVKYGD